MLTLTDEAVGGRAGCVPTRKVALAERPRRHAMIFALPVLRARTRPEAVIVATPTSLEYQITAYPTSKRPWVSRKFACARVVSPTFSEESCNVTSIDSMRPPKGCMTCMRVVWRAKLEAALICADPSDPVTSNVSFTNETTDGSLVDQ